MALVEIARFLDPVEAQIAAGGLRARGVYVFLQNEQAAQAMWYMSFGLGGVRLWTLEADAEAARALVGADRRKAGELAPSGSVLLTLAALTLSLAVAVAFGWAAVVLFRARRRMLDE